MVSMIYKPVPALLKQHNARQNSWFVAIQNMMPVYLRGAYMPRYLTHVWVWVHTLSFSIRDSMCGFRVYPLAPALQLFDQVKLGTRMDFYTEVLVRLYWRGLVMQWLPVKVRFILKAVYLIFAPLADNLLISKIPYSVVFRHVVALHLIYSGVDGYFDELRIRATNIGRSKVSEAVSF